jgi:hypothetical protein
MLAQLETGRVTSRLDCQPRYAIYQAIPAHVRRVAGREQVRGPRYRIETDGSLRRDGIIQPTGEEYLHYQLRKSVLFRMMEARVRESDRRLYVKLVKTSGERVERDFPGAEFHVILWAPGPQNKWMIDRLRAEGLRVHLIDDVLPDYRTDPGSLVIRHDGHPNAKAHDGIAAYVAERILR